jgi:hypothetical protein
MTRTLKLTAAVCALACATQSAIAATFVEIARFDVSASADSAGATFIGNNPAAVAWNGRKLFIAGYNASGAIANTAIVEVTNANSTGLQTAALSAPFGVLATPNLRGYSGLDIQGTVLAAAYDDGAADPNGLQAFDTNGNTLSWSKNIRGGSGVAFDPGFGSVDAGVAWTTFGSGRRALQDTASGADIYTTANGMIINDTTVNTGSFWRDMDFDPATGDIYARRSNAIIKSTRTGGNSVTGTTSLIAVNPSADFVSGHNLSFLSDTIAGDLLIYNDRPSTAAAAFGAVVKVMDTAGAAQAANFVLIGPAPADGAGYYDFDFDPTTQTLALVDFANRNVHIFSVVPEPASFGLALVGLLGFAARRR